MDHAYILCDAIDIIFIVTHSLKPLCCLFELEYILSELRISCIKVVIIDIVPGAFKFVFLCTQYHADSTRFQLIFPLHFHEEIVGFLLRF